MSPADDVKGPDIWGLSALTGRRTTAYHHSGYWGNVMQRLNSARASFVSSETPSSHMHTGALAALGTSTAPGGYQLDAPMGARAGLLPPFVRRPVAVPFGLDRSVSGRFDKLGLRTKLVLDSPTAGSSGAQGPP